MGIVLLLRGPVPVSNFYFQRKKRKKMGACCTKFGTYLLRKEENKVVSNGGTPRLNRVEHKQSFVASPEANGRTRSASSSSSSSSSSSGSKSVPEVVVPPNNGDVVQMNVFIMNETSSETENVQTPTEVSSPPPLPPIVDETIQAEESATSKVPEFHAEVSVKSTEIDDDKKSSSSSSSSSSS